MPWSTKPRKNLIFLFEDQEIIYKILGNVKSRVMQWAKTRAGALPIKYGDQNGNLDEEYFA